MPRLGPPFDPQTVFVYNDGASAIAAGQAVQWGDAVKAHEQNEPDYSAGQRTTLTNQSTRTIGVTSNIPSIKRADTVSVSNTMCGVALADIAITAWGWVATQGLVDVYIGPSANITANDLLIVSAAGAFAENPGIATCLTIQAIAMEATITSGTCAAAMISAFIPASGIPGDLVAGGATTA